MNNYNPNYHHRESIRLKGYDYSQEGLYFITICVEDMKCLFGKIIIGVENGGIENFQSGKEMKLNDAGTIAHECWLQIPEHFPNVVLHAHIIMPNHIHGIIELKRSVGTSHVMSVPDIHDNSGNAVHNDFGNSGNAGHDIPDNSGNAGHDIPDNSGNAGHDIPDNSGNAGHDIPDNSGNAGHDIPDNSGNPGHDVPDNSGNPGHGNSGSGHGNCGNSDSGFGNFGSTIRTSHVMSLRHIHNQFSKPIRGSIAVIIQQYKSSVTRFVNKNNISDFGWQSRFYERIIRNERSYEQIAEYIMNNPKNWERDDFFNRTSGHHM